MLSLQKLNATRDQSISSSILVFVPAVGRTDFDLRKGFLHIIDVREQFRTGEVASVKGLGANGDSID